MRKKKKIALAILIMVLLIFALASCGEVTTQNYSQESDLPEGTTLLLLTDIMRVNAGRYAISVKAGMVPDAGLVISNGIPQAIGDKCYLFLLSEGDVGDDGYFRALAWEPGWDGLVHRTTYYGAPDFHGRWFLAAKENDYSETAFEFSFNENGEINSLTEFEDRSGTNAWEGINLSFNLDYFEKYEIQGDPGEYMSAAEAAKLSFDTARLSGHIPGYDGSCSYNITLVDLVDIKGEECYIFRCDGWDFAVGLACAYQSGNVYMQSSDGQWVLLEVVSINPADVNWWGKYNSVDYVLGIVNYNGRSFYFTIYDGDADISGVAALNPDNPYEAQYGEMVFTFDGFDTVFIEGGDHAGMYYRSQNQD